MRQTGLARRLLSRLGQPEESVDVSEDAAALGHGAATSERIALRRSQADVARGVHVHRGRRARRGLRREAREDEEIPRRAAVRQRAEALQRALEREVLDNAHIVFCTLAGAGEARRLAEVDHDVHVHPHPA